MGVRDTCRLAPARMAIAPESGRARNQRRCGTTCPLYLTRIAVRRRQSFPGNGPVEPPGLSWHTQRDGIWLDAPVCQTQAPDVEYKEGKSMHLNRRSSVDRLFCPGFLGYGLRDPSLRRLIFNKRSSRLVRPLNPVKNPRRSTHSPVEVAGNVRWLAGVQVRKARSRGEESFRPTPGSNGHRLEEPDVPARTRFRVDSFAGWLVEC